MLIFLLQDEWQRFDWSAAKVEVKRIQNQHGMKNNANLAIAHLIDSISLASYLAAAKTSTTDQTNLAFFCSVSI